MNGYTIVVSDGNSEGRIIDISTSMKQICGRIRDSKYKNRVTYVCPFPKKLELSWEEYKAFIDKELENTILGFTRPNHGYLESWARQGVLLLNTVLTVRAGQAHSHASLGWETFTDKVISLINQHREGVVFLLWGSHAQKKGAIIDKQRHHVLKAPHPSPLSAHRGFFGCNHFVLANQWLEQHGETPIDWMPVLPAESE